MIDPLHPPPQLETSLGLIQVGETLGRGKSGYSYQGQLNRQSVVVKVMHDEPCEFYDFGSANKVDLEYRAYEQLQEMGITIPELLVANRDDLWLVKTYVPGTVGSQAIAQGMVTTQYVSQLWDMGERARAKGYNLDYFPSNFVMTGDNLVYIDYELNPYSREWDLEHWGLFYWFNQAGFEAYLKDGDIRHLNEDSGSGIPIKSPFQGQVDAWVNHTQGRGNHGRSY